MTTPSSMEEKIVRIDGSFDRIERRLQILEYWQMAHMGAIAASILTTVLTRLF